MTSSVVGVVDVSLVWIVLGYALITSGELCCTPVGLAAISKVAPKDIVAILFGLWGIKSAFANFIAAAIATLTDAKAEGAETAQATPAEGCGQLLHYL